MVSSSMLIRGNGRTKYLIDNCQSVSLSRITCVCHDVGNHELKSNQKLQTDGQPEQNRCNHLLYAERDAEKEISATMDVPGAHDDGTVYLDSVAPREVTLKIV